MPRRPRGHRGRVLPGRLYLAVEHIDDLLLGWRSPSRSRSARSVSSPERGVPVAYRRGNTAHVDVTGARGKAIRQGVRDQLGLTVTEITRRLESSPGPRRCGCGPRAARRSTCSPALHQGSRPRRPLYKIWRTILYGSLEDEHPFQTVRRLASTRTTPAPAARRRDHRSQALRIVEITPNGVPAGHRVLRRAVEIGGATSTTSRYSRSG